MLHLSEQLHADQLVHGTLNLCRELLHTVGLANKKIYLTFVGPCIVIYFYSKTNQMHNISNLFYFRTTFNMFRTVFPSIISSLRVYIQHQVYVHS
jgi:hypothetical protein